MIINIGILDDHQIVIQGLKLLLENESKFNVIIESNDALNLFEKLAAQNPLPDVLLMDLMMPNKMSGYDAAIELKKLYPNLKVLILSMSEDASLIKQLIEYTNTKGFISKTVDKKDFIAAIEVVHGGGSYFTDNILDKIDALESTIKSKETIKLSAREVEIINLIAQGRTSKEIAALIFLSELTVATHRKNIFRKIGAHNTASLIDAAKRLELI